MLQGFVFVSKNASHGGDVDKEPMRREKELAEKEKRRLQASLHVPNQAFEVQSSSRKKAVICRSDGMPYRKPTSKYFTSFTGSIGSRPYRRLYNWAVFSYTKDRSSASSSYLRKCSFGTRSSIATMCTASCIPFTFPQPFFLFYYIPSSNSTLLTDPNRSLIFLI